MVADLKVDADLPIAAHQAEIAALILGHQVVVVAGETGSGKTTQLPKIALACGRARIGHTQPRRIAARSVATRIAAETGTPLGQLVGYQVRFEAQGGPGVPLKVMTDGILLSEIAHDKLLRRYDTIIIDEAHERSLNIDFLLGYLKQLLPKRPDLKVIITSATIDTARFSQHFGGAPIVEVSGRGYPIEVRYEPVDGKDQVDAIVTALRALPPDHDTLVFLAGEREIRDTAAAVVAARLPGTEVLPLYSRLSLAEQTRVFAPHDARRVVLATNVAETSLTVPGIRCVIDPGFARISRYSTRTKVQRLPIEPISRASADQRAGRCGRVAPGVCVRLYSQDDYLSRPAFTQPEMLRTNLASVILAMTRAGLGEVAGFPFVDPPDAKNVADGVRLLTELGALRQGVGPLRLTSLGRRLSDLPIDPALARIVLAGNDLGCLREAIIVAAGFSLPDVRERPLDARGEADTMHARFSSDAALAKSQEPVVAEPQTPARITVHTGWGAFRGRHNKLARPVSADGPAAGGDIAALLRLWRYLGDAQADLSGNQFRKLCQREFLSHQRVREWQDLVSQLRTVARGLKMHATVDEAPIEDVVRACLYGNLSHIGALQTPAAAEPKRRGPKEYLGARGARFAIAPDSVLSRHEPAMVLALELVETSRLWARGVAAVDPAWVEQAGAPFLRHRYDEPSFSVRSRAVVATRHTSLFGVPLGTAQVDYSGVDEAVARALFVQAGLVEGQLTARAGSPTRRVLDHNAAVRAAVDAWEVKSRRRGLMVDDVALAAWFAKRLPPEVVSGATLDAWLATAGPAGETGLMLEESAVLAAAAPSNQDYPDTWTVGPDGFSLEYQFTPGDSNDGVTVDVPLGRLATLPSAPFSWGVPGQRHELATALIKGLPKATRKKVVPAAHFATLALEWLAANHEDTSRSFCDELGRALAALTGETITGWDVAGIPAHLLPAFRVDDGATTHVSRDLGALQQSLGKKLQTTLTKATLAQAKVGATWVFDTLPEQVRLRRGDVTAVAFPALQDARTGVKQTYQTSLSRARRTHRQGVARLVALALPDPSKGVFAHLGRRELALLATGPYQDVTALLHDARDGAIVDLLGKAVDPWLVRDEAAFLAAVAAVRPNQATAMAQIVQLASLALDRWGSAQLALAACDPSSPLALDVASQLDDLVFEGFLHAISPQWLRRVPVWLDGVIRRLEVAAVAPQRDARGRGELAAVLEGYAALSLKQAEADEKVDEIGYLIEELRLQLFAQPVRTIAPVSPKRLLAAIASVGA